VDEARRQVEGNLHIIEESQKSLEEKDEALEVKGADAHESQSVAQGLLKNGTDHLVEDCGEYATIIIATIMIQSSRGKIREANEALTMLDEDRKKIR